MSLLGEIAFRAGRLEDCDRLAALIRSAAGGTVDYLFGGLVAGQTAVEILAHSLAQNRYPHGYETALVAARGDLVVGMALGFPARYHGINAEMEAFFPAERLDHMRAFFTARVEGSWFLDALGVVREHRRQGIARRLIEKVKAQAAARECRQLSLMVFADNAPALALYEAVGFRVLRPVPLAGNDLIPHQGGCLLMACDL